MTILPYQDRSLTPSQRAEDLLPRLSLERKCGLLFHMMIFAMPLDMKPPMFPIPSTAEYLDMGITHFNIVGNFPSAAKFAEWTNALQAAAAERGLPPVTLSTDPRHAFSDHPQLGMSAGAMSQWPEAAGLAALGSEERMFEFANIVRQEYRAVGISAALHPQADITTEPRWSRIHGSLGEDSGLAARLAAAHIRGLQGEAYGPTSVSACVKHFPGGGGQDGGLDPHFAWGAEQSYPGGMKTFEDHLKPFRAAVDAGVRVVMPGYGKPMGLKFPEVAFAFNKPVLDILPEMGFEGVCLSDWAVISDMENAEEVGDLATARAWGVEHLSREERVLKALEAGVDQFGGEYCVDLLCGLVKDGKVAESRIDRSARKVLVDKFALGLYDRPTVDVAGTSIVGCEEFMAAGLRAQKDSCVLLKKGVLPLSGGTKIFAEGWKDTAALSNAGMRLVDSPEEADVAVIRLKAPFEPMGKGDFTKLFHHGSLDFPESTLERVRSLAQKTKVVVEVYCDRPAILAEIDEVASSLLITFGIQEPALVDVLLGWEMKGRLPFDLPRSMEAVKAARSDTAFDVDALYKFGYGLGYSPAAAL